MGISYFKTYTETATSIFKRAVFKEHFGNYYSTITPVDSLFELKEERGVSNCPDPS